MICRTRFEGSRWRRELCKGAICHRDNLQKREGKRGQGRSPFFLALTWVRGTPIQLLASFQQRAGLNQNDGFFSRNPKSLNRERGKKGGSLDLPGFSNRDPLLLPFWVLMGLSIPLLTSSWAAPKLLGLSPLAPRVHVST